jgi:hypothetical protein
MKLRTLAVAATLTAVTSVPNNVAAQDHDKYLYVSKVTVKEDSHLWINVQGNFSNAHHCPQHDFAVSQQPLSDDRTRAWLQIALASLLARTKIYIVTDATNCSAIGGAIGFPIITALQAYLED